MPKTTFQIPQRTLQNGDNTLPTVNVPIGSIGVDVILDASNWVPGMHMIVNFIVTDDLGTIVGGGNFDVTAPGIPKNTTLSVIDFHPRWGPPAGRNWSLDTTYTLTNGPLVVPGGTINVLS